MNGPQQEVGLAERSEEGRVDMTEKSSQHFNKTRTVSVRFQSEEESLHGLHGHTLHCRTDVVQCPGEFAFVQNIDFA